MTLLYDTFFYYVLRGADFEYVIFRKNLPEDPPNWEDLLK